MNQQVKDALYGKEVIVDITTTGCKSGAPRRMEIWSHSINGQIIITGTPGPRGFLANLMADPDFTFHLKGDVTADLPATARIITDLDERRVIMSAPETAWYRKQVASIDELVAGSPMLEVIFSENQ